MTETTNGVGPAPCLEQLLGEQARDWMRGQCESVGVYLARQPALAGQADATVELIHQEIIFRLRKGETPRIEDYLADYPDLAKPVSEILQLHNAISLPAQFPAAPGTPLDADTKDGSAALRASPVIPGYTIERMLGSGGMGVVYLADDVALKRKVALKLLRHGFADDPGHRARFEREAAAAAKCQHPNLVQIFHIGEHDGEYYLALEYVEGDTLGKTMAGEPQPPRAAAALVEKLARAVDHAHGRGVVHRDLKPANVLLSKDGEPKITDFGLARLDDSSTRTEVGTFLGTLAYMAPEQARGETAAVGTRTDIHALGVILYEALTGRPPYRADTPENTLHKILLEEVLSPTARRPGIPRDLESICLKCLEKRPNDRYTTAVDLAEDLRRFLDGHAIVARPVSPAGRVWRWCRRNPKLAGLAAALLLTILAGTPTLFGLWLRAEANRTRAESEAATAVALNEFIVRDLLAQASAHMQAGPAIKPDRNLMVRTMLDRAAEKIGERFADRPVVEASIQHVIGETYFYLGLYEHALQHLKRAREIRQRQLGENHPDTLDTIMAIGTVYRADGRLPEAERPLLQAMNGLIAARGPEDPRTLAASHAVAQLYYYQGKLPEAERLLVAVRDAYERRQGASGSEVIDVTNSLAMVYYSQRKLGDAERLLSDAIPRSREAVGIEHPDTLTAMSNLSLVFKDRGKKAEAEELCREVTETKRRLLGPNHPETLNSMALLGSYYADDDKLDKAEPLLLEALAGCRIALDPNHEITALTLSALSQLYGKRGNLKKLGSVLVETCQITSMRHGPNSADTAGATQAAGMCFLVDREYPKAEPYLSECVSYWAKNHPDTGDRFFNELQYGISLLAQRKYWEAKQHLLIGYNGMRPDRERNQSPEDIDLSRLIELISQLRDDKGNTFENSTLALLHNDPAIRAIVFDLGFPANPFAP